MEQVSTVFYKDHGELRKVHASALELSDFTVNRILPDFLVDPRKSFDGVRCGHCPKTSRKAHVSYLVNPKTVKGGLVRRKDDRSSKRAIGQYGNARI